MSARRWLPAATIALLAAVFAWLNRGERVVVNFGLFHFYRAPVTLVVLLAFLAGMLAMVWLGLRHDRRVREELRARGLLDPAPPAPAARPAASAWGVAREPAPTRADADRTSAPNSVFAPSHGDGDRSAPHLHEERTVVHPRDEDRTVAYLHEDRVDADPHGDGDRSAPHLHEERTVHPRDEDRTVAYLHEERADAHPHDERTLAHPHHERTEAHPREDDRTVAYPRMDEDPAA